MLSFVEMIRSFESLGDRKSERIQHQKALKRVKRVLRTIVRDIPLEGGKELPCNIFCHRRFPEFIWFVNSNI